MKEGQYFLYDDNWFFRAWNGILQVCVCLSKLLILQSEVTTREENVIEMLIAITGVNNEQILIAVYSEC